MTVEQLAKVSSTEVYISSDLLIDCPCSSERACVLCIDNGLYGDDQLPPPPPYIVIPHEGYMDEEQQAYYKGEAPPLQLDEAAHMLIHCEDESACRFCNGALPPSELQVDGPKSCPKYYESCLCLKCEARDRWYKTEAT